jgi:hypothetical protein
MILTKGAERRDGGRLRAAAIFSRASPAVGILELSRELKNAAGLAIVKSKVGNNFPRVCLLFT